jgi:hypothetical protein
VPDIVNREGRGRVASRVTRLSTGIKMLLILSLGLLPLGLVAILASVESARTSSAERAGQIASRLSIRADRINDMLTRSAGTIRASAAAISLAPIDSGICEHTLLRLERMQRTTGRFALFGPAGAMRCASPGYAPSVPANPGHLRSMVTISDDGSALRFALFNDEGALEGIGEFPREELARLTYVPEPTGDFDLSLRQGKRTMVLRSGYAGNPMGRMIETSAPVAGGGMLMQARLAATPISAAEILMILLPILMCLFVAAIGWGIVHRLLLKPLVRMQRAVAAYQPGDRHLDLPSLSTPAREIGELGLAFDRVTQTVARHEAELEAGIERQKRLVREVHHRVKNNLQVVASLLNLHARGAASEDVAKAYASIQRRVDALAVVHRNHYAELEENRGVALKPLISELAANLRATAPASAARMAIRLDLEPYYVTQDVAVSVAFLITEIVEFAMLCGAPWVLIALDEENDYRARLAVESPSLAADVDCGAAVSERFERVVTGLSRQLRSTLDRDPATGRYALDIAVLEKGPL